MPSHGRLVIGAAAPIPERISRSVRWMFESATSQVAFADDGVFLRSNAPSCGEVGSASGLGAWATHALAWTGGSADAEGAEIADAVDDIIEEQLRKGGDVRILPNGTLGQYNGMALVLRY